MGWPKGKPRPNRAPRRIAKTAQPVIGAWVDLVRGAVADRRAEGIPGMSEDNIAIFAGYMRLLGTADDPQALDLFGPFCQMLLARRSAPQRAMVRGSDPLRKGRIYFFATNRAFLPVTRVELIKVGEALKAAGEIEYVERATFKVNHFVEVALALSDPYAYVEASKNFGLDQWKIGTVFHPNTLERWTGVYRGMLGSLADPAYDAQVRASVQTIT